MAEILFQCPSCWADPHCPDCAGVIAAAAFWGFAFILLVIALIAANRKDKK